MKTKEFLSSLAETEIVAAIQAAESKTSGEIRVLVSERRVDDPLAVAQREFRRLGMHKTRERNGVLLLVAPVSQAFAIAGDTGIHERCGEAFWTDTAAQLERDFRAGQFTQGIVRAIHSLATVLARHFPRQADDQNELPNEIIRQGPS